LQLPPCAREARSQRKSISGEFRQRVPRRGRGHRRDCR
jgi:hypothetical protein